MNAFSNENIKDNLCGGCDCVDFAPSLGFVYDDNAATIVVTDNSVYSAGDSRKVVQISIRDKNGDKAVSSISAADGDDAVTVSVSALDPSGGFTILATVVSANGCISDGHADFVGLNVTSGDLGYWDKDNDAITVGSSESNS
jgi:hypothetical protein